MNATINKVHNSQLIIFSFAYQKLEELMKTNAPKHITWIICLVLGILGLLGQVATIPVISGIAFWLVVIGLGLLLLATVLKDL